MALVFFPQQFFGNVLQAAFSGQQEQACGDRRAAAGQQAVIESGSLVAGQKREQQQSVLQAAVDYLQPLNFR